MGCIGRQKVCIEEDLLDVAYCRGTEVPDWISSGHRRKVALRFVQVIKGLADSAARIIHLLR